VWVHRRQLKAPLRGIAHLAQWIQDDAGEKLTGDSAEHLRLLHSRVHRMDALIDGILAYSRAGRSLKQAELVDTGALVGEVVEMHGGSVQAYSAGRGAGRQSRPGSTTTS
jgi:light-regulated signal transduction histidine kinase (bacteriophytochrome)